jgi:hypothetical protein
MHESSFASRSSWSLKFKYNPECTFEQEDANERLMNDGLGLILYL